MALALGCTHAELLNRMSARELKKWHVFFLLEPFGSITDNLNAGHIVAALINVNRKKGKPLVTMSDVALGDFKTSTTKAKSPKEIKKLMMGLVKND